MLVEDFALLPDQKGLGNAVDAPVYGGPPRLVDPDCSERIPKAAQEATGVLRLVLVVQAGHREATILGQFHEQRMLLSAGRAP